MIYKYRCCKNMEIVAKKRDCEDIWLWMNSSVKYCFWLPAASGDDGEMKERNGSS